MKDFCMLLNNILEMIMCRAFQSLPGLLIEEYFGLLPNSQGYSNLGLNIIPPLIQGQRLDPHKRHSFTLQLTVSKDTEIQN